MIDATAMQDTDIFVKTDAGRDEIRSRALGLPMSVRAILLMIDGQRTVSAMRTIIAGSKAPADVLDGLVAQGLIEPVSAPVTVAPAAATRAAVIARPQAATSTPIAKPAVAPRVAEPAGPAPATGEAARFSFDGPLDLTLPTIRGAEAGPAAADIPVEVPTAASSAASSAANRYEHLYGMMNEIVRDFLSPTRRYFFQLKIERCGTSDDLLELLHDLQTALAKTRGDAFASEVISRLRNAAV